MSEVLKIEAAGNDFIFFDGALEVPSMVRIRSLCDRHFGIGADGVAVMFRIDGKTSRWGFFNNDGSSAAMCGNAARAAAAWVHRQGLEFPHTLHTDFGPVILNSVKTESGTGESQFSAEIPYDKKPLRPQTISAAFSHADICDVPILVDTGVPHVVVEMSNSVLERARRSDAAIFKEVASHFRWVEEAGPAGANVTFFSRLEELAIQSVTFERGVEDLTLACGTGVLAAAVVASGVLTKNTSWPKLGFRVETLGAWLSVESQDFPNALTLIGPANITFSAQLISLRS